MKEWKIWTLGNVPKIIYYVKYVKQFGGESEHNCYAPNTVDVNIVH